MQNNSPEIKSRGLKAIRKKLLKHYHTHHRKLPWRETSSPYKIWVSEIMLQQTGVSTVVPRYLQFLETFPTLEALAAATEEQVCEAWAGLGYYRRARHLHQAAQKVVTEHEGRLPTSARALLNLPGIGRYTAGAILSIAFGQEAPLVDGNVVRVIARLFALERPASDPTLIKFCWEIAESLVEGPDPGDFNQSLMELGATLCTPKKPLCESCPIKQYCRAHAQQRSEELPLPAIKAAKKNLQIAFARIETEEGLWLRQRPLDGLWAGLWELPSAEGRGAKTLLEKVLNSPLGRPIGKIKHELTHRQVNAVVYRPRAPLTPQGTQKFKPFKKPLEAPLSALARKAILASD